ncbi:MAG: hypothetical protein RID91_07985 [Azospirillaceae bacterium]
MPQHRTNAASAEIEPGANVIPFPVRPRPGIDAGAPSATNQSAANQSEAAGSDREGGDRLDAGAEDDQAVVFYAASAGAVAGAAIVDMIAAGGEAGPAPSGDTAPVDFGVLWGVVLGIAARHGQLPALCAVESLLEELREDPYHYLVEQRDAIEAAGDLKARTGNILGALLVETHDGPYTTRGAE